MSLIKLHSQTYLYNISNLEYNKNIIKFLMTAGEINKNDTSFEDIRYDVKRRQISNSLLKVLDSHNVKLMTYPKPLPKAFKVFTAIDIKKDNKRKVFVDADIIKKVDGKYACNNIDILISYLVSAMNQLIYYSDPKKLLMNSDIIKSGSKAFSELFTNIIDYLYKISVMHNGTKGKCLYLAAIYYQINILGKDINDSVKSIARRIGGLSEREEELLFIQLENNSFNNIKFFIDTLNKVLRLNKLTLDVFLEKWLFLYGVGTQFALELYPAFATMMTDAYVGSYLNNQKTIEKVTGRSMIEVSTAILRVGSDLK